MKTIAIIGTRDVSPEKMVKAIEFIEDYLFRNKITVEAVYSGNAEGMDQVATYFSQFTTCVHFLPWKTYNIHLHNNSCIYELRGDNDLYDDLIYKLFPWIRTKPTMLGLIRRNMFIILGDQTYKRIDLLFWYTGKGVIGGTAYGIKTAVHFGIKLVEIII